MGEKEEKVKTKKIIKKFGITDCTKCGNECADSCPVYRHYGAWHPRDLAARFIEEGEAGIGKHRLLWSCVTCSACTVACPFDVPFADFIRELRIGRTGYRPVKEGLIHAYQRSQADLPEFATGLVTHGKTMHSSSTSGTRAITHGVAKKDRLFWIDRSIRIDGDGDTVLFTGCIPFFEAVFGETCGIQPVEMLRSAVKILNRLDIAPAVLEDERCCGRDLFDIGDRSAFEKLAGHNMAVLKKSGAKRVLTVCPECAYTLRSTYADFEGELPFEVDHITGFIAQHLDRLGIERGGGRYAIHEPCYLSRYLDSTEALRTILSSLAGDDPVELERQGKETPCCGAGSWIDHGPHTRTAVNERIVEAHRCGADSLVTACPKCLILFHEVNPSCSWKQSPVAVEDLLSLVARALDGGVKDK